ncbi:MAG: GNAT family N-acetyltransferase [Planctomycetota bacterium]
MAAKLDSQWIVRVPGEDEWASALALALAHMSQEERVRLVERITAQARNDTSVRSGLHAAFHQGRLHGAMLAQLQSGRSAVCWLPQLTTGVGPAVALALMEATNAWLDASGVAMAQIMADVVEAEVDSAIGAGGFRHLADLLYLVCAAEHFPAEPPPTALSFQMQSASTYAQLVQVIESTYEATRDCPQMNGWRSTADVLAGYRATGEYDASLWLIAEHQGRGVGCLILARHSELECLELVYMGVVPAARGWGFGLDLTRRALWEAKLRGLTRLVLAVDADNAPAMRIYTSLGFRAWDRRRVYVRLGPPAVRSVDAGPSDGRL